MTVQASTLLTTFEHDVNLSATEKVKCLKMLKTILQNLADPLKAQDEKYRQLRCGNPKIQALLRHVPIKMTLMHVVGFETVRGGDSNDEQILKLVDVPSATTVGDVLALVTGSLQRLSVLVPSSTASSTSSTVGLSEKQKARLLREQQLEKEKREAEASRKRTAAQIQADKYVRQNDPNWKPCVNAAAAKTGDSISTFRDKYGEN